MNTGKIIKSFEKFGNSFDNTGSYWSRLFYNTSQKTLEKNPSNMVANFISESSITMGAAMEGMALGGTQGAIVGGAAAVIDGDDDTSFIGGAIKGAAVGATIGGVKEGAISHYLQKTSLENGGIGISSSSKQLRAADYSRVNLNKEILVNRAFNQVNSATRVSDLTVAENMMKHGAYEMGDRKQFFKDIYEGIKDKGN